MRIKLLNTEHGIGVCNTEGVLYRRAGAGQNCPTFVYGSEELEKATGKGEI